jgi:hypothetical protein
MKSPLRRAFSCFGFTPTSARSIEMPIICFRIPSGFICAVDFYTANMKKPGNAGLFHDTGAD